MRSLFQAVKQFTENELMHTYGCTVICALTARFLWIKYVIQETAEHEIKQAVRAASETGCFWKVYKAAGRQHHYPSDNKEAETA